MMRITVLVAAVACALVIACGSKDPPMADAPKAGSAAFGSACTTVSDTSTECTSGVCTDSINQLGIVCSQKCTLLNMDDPSCPMGSMGKKCNMKGYCRP